MNKIKVPKPSPCCGSYYRNVDENDIQYCNGNQANSFTCGKECIPCHDKPDKKYIPKRHGKQWNKKLHRYLTEDEIKRGMKGG